MINNQHKGNYREGTSKVMFKMNEYQELEQYITTKNNQEEK